MVPAVVGEADVEGAEVGEARAAEAAIPEATSAESRAPRRILIAVSFPSFNTSGSKSAMMTMKIPKPIERNMGIVGQ